MKKTLLCLLLMAIAFNSYAGTGYPTIHRSGTITTGGTFQTISIPTGARVSVDFQNLCSTSGLCNATTDVCYIYFGSGTATTANSTVLQAGQGYLRSEGAIPNDVIQVTCTTTGDTFKLDLQ